MTSFEQQLNKISQQQSIFQNDRQKASLLFNFQAAAGFSLDTIYSIAINGLMKLEKINAIYAQFKELLSEENKKIDRQILTQSENDQLQIKLKNFLLVLSNDFLNENCQKVLEYLIKNYEVFILIKIHVHEKDWMIIYFLSYHSHPLFVKLVQNVNLQNSKHFAFLDISAKQGLSFNRNLLAKQISFDVWILESLINSIYNYYQIQENDKDIVINKNKINIQNQNLRVQFTTALIIDILNLKNQGDNLIQKILSFGIEMLKRNNVSSLYIFMEVIQKQDGLKQEVINTIASDVFNQIDKIQDKQFIKQIFLFINQLVWQKKLEKLNFKSLLNKNIDSQNIIKSIQEIGQDQSLMLFFLIFFQNSIKEEKLFCYYEPWLSTILNHDSFLQQIRNQFLHKMFEIYTNNFSNQQIIQLFKKFALPEYQRYLLTNSQNQNVQLIIKKHFPNLDQILKEQQQQKSINFIFNSNDKNLILQKLSEIQKNQQSYNQEYKQYIQDQLINLFNQLDDSEIQSEVLNIFIMPNFGNINCLQILIKNIITKIQKNIIFSNQTINNLLNLFGDLDINNDELKNKLFQLFLYNLQTVDIDQTKIKNQKRKSSQQNNQIFIYDIKSQIQIILHENQNQIIVNKILYYIQQFLTQNEQIEILQQNNLLLNNSNFLNIIQKFDISQAIFKLILQSNLDESLLLFKQKGIDQKSTQQQLQFLCDLIQFNEKNKINIKICAFINAILQKNQEKIENIDTQLLNIFSKSIIQINNQNSNRTEKITFIYLIQNIKKYLKNQQNCQQFNFLNKIQKAISKNINELSINQISLNDVLEKNQLQSSFHELVNISKSNTFIFNELLKIYLQLNNNQSQEYLQILKVQLKDKFDNQIFENYLKIASQNQIQDLFNFSFNFKEQPTFQEIFISHFLTKFYDYKQLDELSQIQLINLLIKNNIQNIQYIVIPEETAIKLLQNLNFQTKQFILEYLLINSIQSNNIQIEVIKSLKQIQGKLNYENLATNHLEFILFQKEKIETHEDQILLSYLKILKNKEEALDDPNICQQIYLLFKIFLKYCKTKFIVTRLNIMNKNTFQFFDLIRFTVKETENVQKDQEKFINLLSEVCFSLKNQEKINQFLNLYQDKKSIVVLSLIRQCQQNNNFDQSFFNMIQNCIQSIDDLQEIIKICSKGFEYLRRFLQKDKKVNNLSFQLKLQKKDLRVVIRTFMILCKTTIQNLQIRFEKDFSSIIDVNPDTPIIILLSQLYLNVFNFDYIFANHQLPPIYKTKVVKQLKQFCIFLINFFPFEFLSLISTLFIQKLNLDINIKAKFLEYFQMSLQKKDKNISKKAQKTLKYIGEEVLSQLLNLKKMDKPEQNYSQKIVSILAIISLKKNILDSNSLINSFYSTIETKIDYTIKAQAIYLISFQTKNNQEQFLQKIKLIVNQTLQILKINDEASQNILFKSLQLFIQNIGGILSPYLQDIITAIIGNSNETINDLMIQIGEQIEPRILVPILENIIKNCESQLEIQRISQLIGSLCQKLDSENFEYNYQSIFKIFLTLFDFSRKQINKEIMQDIGNIENSIYYAFEYFALKCNKVILRKLFLQLVNWSDKQFVPSECGFMYPFYRKNFIFGLMKNLVFKMTNLFIPFYTYTFDNMVQILKDFTQIKKALKNTKKRVFQEQSQYYILQNQQIEIILKNFQKCFEYDSEQFIDTSKFEQLAEILPKIYDCHAYPQINYEYVTENILNPTLIELFNLVNDDYKWKTLNYIILNKLKSDNIKVKIAILKFLHSLIDKLKDRFGVLIQDSLPFLAETLDDENEQIEKMSKSIVIQLEQVTGENIREYLKY